MRFVLLIGMGVWLMASVGYLSYIMGYQDGYHFGVEFGAKGLRITTLPADNKWLPKAAKPQ